MSIPFTQFLMPDGREKPVTIDRPSGVEAKARALIEAGFRFEIEMLQTGEISMEICDSEGETVLGAEVCGNGPQVPVAIDKMIEDATKQLATETKETIDR